MNAVPVTTPDNKPNSLLDKKLAGKYSIEDLVGEGGFGSVYRAIQEPLGRKVAVKVIKPGTPSGGADLKKRFLHEAQLLAKFNSPNIVQIFDYGEKEGLLYMVLELIGGRSLSKLIEEEKNLSVDDIINIMVEIINALDEVHKKGLVHRDLKPSNIMVIDKHNGKKSIKLIDFGIAQIIDSKHNPQTQAASFIGDVKYMAPERFKDRDNISHKTDQYALGIILYKMLFGVVPFDGSTIAIENANINKKLHSDENQNIADFQEVITIVSNAHMNEDPYLDKNKEISGSQARMIAIVSAHIYEEPNFDKNKEIADSLKTIVERALAKKPDERFSDLNEMRGALHDCQKKEDKTILSFDIFKEIRLIIASLVLGLLMIAFGGYVMMSTPPIPPISDTSVDAVPVADASIVDAAPVEVLLKVPMANPVRTIITANGLLLIDKLSTDAAWPLRPGKDWKDHWVLPENTEFQRCGGTQMKHDDDLIKCFNKSFKVYRSTNPVEVQIDGRKFSLEVGSGGSE